MTLPSEMGPTNSDRTNEELDDRAVPTTRSEFEAFAADVERADWEGTLDYWRQIVGEKVIESLLAGQDFDAEFRHHDEKRREAAIWIAMKRQRATKHFIEQCLQLARFDKSISVRESAISLLGGIEGEDMPSLASFLRDVVLNDREAIQLRLSAYRSLVYAFGSVSRMRIPPAQTRSVDDIDWAFVNSFQ